MAEELIDKYIDRQGIEQDTKFILDKLNEVYGAFQRLDSVKIGLGSSQGLAATLPLLKSAEEEIGRINATSNELVATQKKQTSAQREVDKAIAEGRVEKQKYNAELKREIELQNASNGSIEQARALVKNLTAERNKLNLSTEEGRKRLIELNRQIDQGNEFIQKNVDTLSKRKINVGNYEGSAKIIVDALERTKDRLKVVEKEFGKLSPEAAAVRSEFEALSKITENPQFLNVSAKIGDASAEVKFFTKALIDLERRGQGNTETAAALRVQLAELTDQIGDAKAEIKALASDTRQFDLVAGTVSFAADAFQTAAGAAQLLGASEEDAAKATSTLIAVQSVANGVKGIANELTTRGTAANKAYAFVQKQVNIVMTEGILTANGLKAAMGLLGIAVTVIGAIVIAVSAMNVKLSDAARYQKNYNDSLKEASGEYVKAVTQITEVRNAFDLAEKGVIRKDEALKLYNTTVGETIGQAQSLNEAEQLLAKNAEAYVQFTLLKAAANIALQESAKKAFEAQLEASKPPEDNTFAANFLSDPVYGSPEKMKAKMDADSRARKEQRIKNLKDEQTSLKQVFEALFKQSVEISKKFSFDFLGNASENKPTEAKTDLKKVALEREKALLEVQADVQRQIVQIDTFSLSERVKALESYIRLKNLIIEKDAEYEKSRKGITAIEILKIETDSRIKRDQLYTDAAKFLKSSDREQVQSKEEAAYDMEQISADLTDNLKKEIEIWVDENAKQYDKDKENYKKAQEEKKRLTESLISELTGLTFTLLTANLERQKNALQTQIDLLDERKQKEIEAANQTVASETDKAAAVAVIEARANAQREQLQRRQRELDVKKAQFDKAQAIARIIQETAQNVVKYIGNPLLLALASAIGAAQLATVIAQPIPRYRTGKNADNYEGPAIVGDGGKRELHIREDGSIEVTPDRPTLTYVRKRDVILPDARAAVDAVVSGQNSRRVLEPGGVKDDGVELAIHAMRKDVVQAISNQPKSTTAATDSGMTKLWKWGAVQTKYINEQTNW